MLDTSVRKFISSVIINNIKKMFIDFLGPLGKNEFEDLKKKGISAKNVLDYIVDIYNKNILDIERAEEFKKDINHIYLQETNKKTGQKN